MRAIGDRLPSSLSPSVDVNYSPANQAVSFFTDSLEEFRSQLQQNGELDKNEHIHLAGHSMGGYLCAHYAMRYPQNIKSLIMISPVGLPAPPPEHLRLRSHEVVKVSWGLYAFATAWASNITPQTIVRMAGPKGQDMVRNILHRRFGGRWDQKELDLVADYLYHIRYVVTMLLLFFVVCVACYEDVF